MSSVGFNTVSPDKELEKLRAGWRSLADVLRNITNAEASLKSGNYQLVADHLGVAKWNVDQVKKAITFVGQAKNHKASRVPQIVKADRYKASLR